MSFTSAVKKFLRGGDGLKGPAKTPPVPHPTHRQLADRSNEVSGPGAKNPRRISRTAAQTKVQMRQAKDQRRHRQNVAQARHEARVSRASR